MATTKNLDPVVLKALKDLNVADANLSLQEQIAKLIQVIEQITAEQQLANRERALRASPDGMYVRNNAGTFISESEAKEALETIQRLDGQKTGAEKNAA
ncbi:hypothetical protein [Dyella sp.]|jgi:hypothetical protein|uniref:hypothetical protein n=1 Tax=Dyella sp. TaxID=1869338 RepID=UPI002C29873D|nr:hypothetical protein [Dyella sp.]HTC25897.1 hypothetical protein [Dyella sp.]